MTSQNTTKAPPVGTLLHAEVGPSRMPLAKMAELDPREAAAQALAAYLAAGVFLIPGDKPGTDKRFKLNAVKFEWPNPKEPLDYPAAAITSSGPIPNDGHNLTPSMLEDTCDRFGAGTVLWKTAELSIHFQVNFWTTNKPERSAILAGLQEMFAPSEDRYGVIVQGPHEYYERTVRLTLDDHERIDTSDTVFQGERELRVQITADVDVVQLRKVTQLEPRILFEDGHTVRPTPDP